MSHLKVFISWSGARSQAVAAVLTKCVPDIVQEIDTWMSEESIDSGERWQGAIGHQLETCDVGIVVVTQDNFEKPWLNFEAGAISKSMKLGRPIPFLFDVRPLDILGSPLMQFQARGASRQDMLELVRDLNKLLPAGPLSSERLNNAFAKHWDAIERELSAIRADPALAAREPRKAREVPEILEQLVEMVRALGSSPIGIPTGATSAAFTEIFGEGLGPLAVSGESGGALQPPATGRLAHTVTLTHDPGPTGPVGPLLDQPTQKPK
jgi:hypothetical protein